MCNKVKLEQPVRKGKCLIAHATKTYSPPKSIIMFIHPCASSYAHKNHCQLDTKIPNTNAYLHYLNMYILPSKVTLYTLEVFFEKYIVFLHTQP